MNSKTSSFIRMIGCREHNLKNLSLTLPKNAITVITGVSGSGKSSLAFDTLFAEGQRRYLEYLSPEAKIWIKQMAKPDVDLIEGLSPTLAIGRGKQTLHPLSSIASSADIYDFLTLLYAHIGEQHSPITGKRLIRYTRQEVVNLILHEYGLGTRLQLLAPIKLEKETFSEAIIRMQQMGFVRFKINGEDWTAEDPMPSEHLVTTLDVVIDRIEIKEGIRDRLAHSVETSMDLSQGILKIQEGRQDFFRFLTEVYVCPQTGYSFCPLTTSEFQYNSIKGACPECHGIGGKEKVNPSLIFINKEIPLYDQVRLILDRFPRKHSKSITEIFQQFWEHSGLSEDCMVNEIPSNELKELLQGSKHSYHIEQIIDEKSVKVTAQWKGLIPLIEMIIQDKKQRNSFEDLPCIEWQVCSKCNGHRLKPEALFCFIQGKGIHQLCQMTVSQLISEIASWRFEGKSRMIADEILPQIKSRLVLLEKVGLGYLQLNREGKTLSDGEAQRVQLTSQIGAKLSGIIYILDEPSLGLHRQDIQHLHHVINELKSLGNTIVLVEHEKSLIRLAEYLIELGPGAGKQGGELIFHGNYAELSKDTSSLTGRWLNGTLKLPPPPKRKLLGEKLIVKDACLHNLKNVNLNIPLSCLVGFCGVSGSGKSTLAIDVIATEMQKHLSQGKAPIHLKGFESIKALMTSEKQLERFSARSIPATYVGIMTPLRQLYAETKLAKARGYTAGRFSLNKRGGRCETCEGLGQVRINMQLMSDLYIPCDVCQGERYNYETLQIHWEDQPISKILSMTVDDALQWLDPIPTIAPTLKLMSEFGLGYITLGQPFNTLSGGEVQRMRLVADIASKCLDKALYILDEPSAGLHLQDIEKLIRIIHRLVDQGHSVFIIEHHLELLNQVDWLIELGPGGGPLGGEVIFEGTPKQILKADTPTGRVMKTMG